MLFDDTLSLACDALTTTDECKCDEDMVRSGAHLQQGRHFLLREHEGMMVSVVRPPRSNY